MKILLNTEVIWSQVQMKAKAMEKPRKKKTLGDDKTNHLGNIS